MVYYGFIIGLCNNGTSSEMIFNFPCIIYYYLNMVLYFKMNFCFSSRRLQFWPKTFFVGRVLL